MTTQCLADHAPKQVQDMNAVCILGDTTQEVQDMIDALVDGGAIPYEGVRDARQKYNYEYDLEVSDYSAVTVDDQNRTVLVKKWFNSAFGRHN